MKDSQIHPNINGNKIVTDEFPNNFNYTAAIMKKKPTLSDLSIDMRYTNPFFVSFSKRFFFFFNILRLPHRVYRSPILLATLKSWDLSQ